jgi:hypothetical protein
MSGAMHGQWEESMSLRMAGLAGVIALFAGSADASLIPIRRGPDPDDSAPVHRPTGPYMDCSWLEQKLNASGSGEKPSARKKGSRVQKRPGQSPAGLGFGAINYSPGPRHGGNNAGSLIHTVTNPVAVNPPAFTTEDADPTTIPAPGAGVMLIGGVGVLGYLAQKRIRSERRAA